MSKLIPLPGYVLISPIEEEEKSAGGIYMPDSAKDKPMKGKVVSMCDFYLTDPKSVVPLNKTVTQMVENIFLKKGMVAMNTLLSDIYSKVRVGSVVIYKKWTNQEVQHEGKEYLLVKLDELMAIIE